MSAPLNNKWYVFIKNYYPHGAPIFGYWVCADSAYLLNDYDLMRAEDLEETYGNENVFFLSHEELCNILEEKLK